MSARRAIDERTAASVALRLRDEPGLTLAAVATEGGWDYEALRRAVRRRQAKMTAASTFVTPCVAPAPRIADRPRVPRACLPLLVAEAQKRQAEPMALAGRILCTVLTGKLVDAVLDEAP